ncbi:MAG: AI-2E family transporter [Myxococcaceae bacterium]
MPLRMLERAPTPIQDRRRRLLVLGGLWVFILAVLIVFRSVVMPFAGAAVIAYLVAPLVNRLTRVRFGKRRLPHWVAILLIYLAFFAAVYLAFIGLVPQLYRELLRISREAITLTESLTPERIHELSLQLDAWLEERGVPVDLSSRALEGGDAGGVQQPARLSVDLEKFFRDLAVRVSVVVNENIGNIVAVSRSVITAVVAGVFMVFFILMVAAFFSIDSEKIQRYVATLFPPDFADDISLLLQMMDRKLAGVLRGQVTICLINGVLTFIGLLLFGVKFAFLLATIATLFSLIPIFGTILSSIPIVLIGLSQSWQTGVGALLWIIGIHALEAYVLNPKIMGSAARIHPIVVAFALIAGERTYGLIGALFAVPIAGLLTACFDFLRLKAQPPHSAAVEPGKP